MSSASTTRSAWSVKSNGPSPSARDARCAGTSPGRTRLRFVREVCRKGPPVRSIVRTVAGGGGVSPGGGARPRGGGCERLDPLLGRGRVVEVVLEEGGPAPPEADDL